MKVNRKVYVVQSLVQNDTLIFGTYRRAEEWIKNYDRTIFDKSDISDLYISKRIIF